MAEQRYKGSLTLDWYNKNKSIILKDVNGANGNNDIPAPKINWVNKEQALFYEISENNGSGIQPYWVDRNDIRVKEARPLVFQKAYRAIKKDKPGTDFEYELQEIDDEADCTDIKNVLIKGDNLLALNTLRKHFERLPDSKKVKCIFIDPPYNTGSAFEQYDDNLEHSEWLTLMRDRLVKLRDVLSVEGTIWISVDDEESHYLKVLCDDVFGRSNFIANVIWEKSDSPRMDATFFSSRHDHILCFAKDKNEFAINQLSSKEIPAHYNRKGADGKAYYLKPLRAMGKEDKREDRPTMFFPIIAPDGTEVLPMKSDSEEGRWRWKKDKVTTEAQRIHWVNSKGKWNPYYKIFADSNSTRPPETIWFHEIVGSNRTSKNENNILFGNNFSFETPKPEQLIERILTIATLEDDLVLDCFGGSGTTFSVAHKMKRKWIGVEIGDHADSHIIPRLKGVIDGSDKVGITKAVNWQGGGAFAYYHLGESIITIDEATGKGKFNWSLGKNFIEESLLVSYNYDINSEIDLSNGKSFQDPSSHTAVGFQRIGTRTLAAAVSLNEESGNHELMSSDEVLHIYKKLKDHKSPEAVTIFTNRGVEMAYDSKPDDLEIVKVPHAIFAELEK